MRQTAIASTSQLAEARIAIPVGMLLDVLVPQDRQSDVLALKLAVNAFGCAGMSLTSTPTPIVSRLLLRDIRLPTGTTHLFARGAGAVKPLTRSRTGAEIRPRSVTEQSSAFVDRRNSGRSAPIKHRRQIPINRHDRRRALPRGLLPSRLFRRLPPCTPLRLCLAGIRKPLTIPDLPAVALEREVRPKAAVAALR